MILIWSASSLISAHTCAHLPHNIRVLMWPTLSSNPKLADWANYNISFQKRRIGCNNTIVRQTIDRTREFNLVCIVQSTQVFTCMGFCSNSRDASGALQPVTFRLRSSHWHIRMKTRGTTYKWHKPMNHFHMERSNWALPRTTARYQLSIQGQTNANVRSAETVL